MPSYILFDTETTGNQEVDRIIQVGAMILHTKSNIEIYDELCSAEQEISIEAMEVHHITPDIIKNKPPYKDTNFASRLEELNKPSNFLIAHNIGFDLGMIKKEGFVNHYKLIDTVRCAKHLYPELPFHRLQYLRYALKLYLDEEAEASKRGITIKAHDAIGDVLILKLLLSKLKQRVQIEYPQRDIMDVMVELTNKPVLMQIFKFGKYKGRLIDEIASEDMGYLQWMYKTLELDEDMRYTLEQYL